MGNSQQRKGKTPYNPWTSKESNMVDAAKSGWRDSNGLLSKQIVESKILPSHPSQVHLQTDTFTDYEDLVIAIGNGTAVGKNSIRLGDDTDVRTYEVGESRPTRLQDEQ
ncbi:unnamed protein product [Prunus armeniaca]